MWSGTWSVYGIGLKHHKTIHLAAHISPLQKSTQHCSVIFSKLREKSTDFVCFFPPVESKDEQCQGNVHDGKSDNTAPPQTCNRIHKTRQRLQKIFEKGILSCLSLLAVKWPAHPYAARGTGAVLGRQNTSSEQRPAQYGRR